MDSKRRITWQTSGGWQLPQRAAIGRTPKKRWEFFPCRMGAFLIRQRGESGRFLSSAENAEERLAYAARSMLGHQA